MSHLAFAFNGVPSVCVRCKTPDSAEGYYETPVPTQGNCRIGICKKHKEHGGSKILWTGSADKSRSK